MDVQANDYIDVGPSMDFHPDTRPVLRVTLTGYSLLLTIFSIIVCIHVVQPSLTAVLIAIALVQCVIYNDYKAFLSLGPGGTPSNFLGYLKLKLLKCFAFRDSEMYTAPPIPIMVRPDIGYFQPVHTITYRPGPRPKIVGLAPQRQADQLGCPVAHVTLRKTLNGLAVDCPEQFFTAVSCFEKKGLALFSKQPLNQTCHGEICHVHHTDGSLHLNLHPMDAQVVIAQGWGQRHPLSRGGWMKRFVPREFLMIYAPRNLEEVNIVAHIIEAAAWWVTGERVQLKIPCSAN